MPGESEVLIDTSVWIALFTEDSRVSRLEERMGNRRALVSSLVLAEIESLSVQGKVVGHAATDVASAARVESLVAEDGLVGGRLHGSLRRKGKSKLSMADALILATARRVGAAVLTLDHDLEGEPDVEVLA